MSWLPLRSASDSPEFPLFCFPYAGGGASLYHQWERQLRDVCRVVPVRLPGREGRISEPAFDDMQQLVTAMLTDLPEAWSRPFALFGHSMGALIAYELACRLTETGCEPRLLFISSCRPPDQLRRDRIVPLHELPREQMLDELIRLYGMENTISPAERALMQMLSPTLQADLKLIYDYHPSPGRAVHCPVIVCGGADDPQVTRLDLSGWQRYFQQPISPRLFPGGHFYLRVQKDPLVRLIHDRIRGLDEGGA